jgi:uncharacterized tellurite resistance protein B-like protein
MIIFGTRGVTYSAGEGEFHCPDCGTQPYRKKRVRRFFTLYFIPLIPLDLLGEYVECGRCKDSYRPDVLDFNPSEADEEFEAEFQIAVKRTMVLMALADGVIDPEEVATICDVYGKIAKKTVTPEAVHAEIEAARADGQGVEEYLSGLLGSLNDSGKELVVRAAFMVAAADGEFQDDEQELLKVIGKSLQMSSAHVNGVIGEMLESFSEDADDLN